MSACPTLAELFDAALRPRAVGPVLVRRPARRVAWEDTETVAKLMRERPVGRDKREETKRGDLPTMAQSVSLAEGGPMTATEQPTLPDTAAPDAAWLAQVRADAGRWWATFDATAGTALTLGLVKGGHCVVHQPSGGVLGGAWPSLDAAKLWLWLALVYANWQLVIAPDTLSAERRDDLAAAERRLRAALGLGAGQ